MMRHRGLLHARGGVSVMLSTVMVCLKSSPRPWRCFLQRMLERDARGVFSTPVEVFPHWVIFAKGSAGLLHARGGVSEKTLLAMLLYLSSPRPWRCFCGFRPGWWGCWVFSTPVEVFPNSSVFSGRAGCLLHARGGVSAMVGAMITERESSPRPWRCFYFLLPRR